MPPLATVIHELLVPALTDIGSEWHEGRLPIWVEHLSVSAIVQRLLGEHDPNPRGRRHGTAMVAALSGDHHGLPTSMAAAALREDNWKVPLANDAAERLEQLGTQALAGQPGATLTELKSMTRNRRGRQPTG